MWIYVYSHKYGNDVYAFIQQVAIDDVKAHIETVTGCPFEEDEEFLEEFGPLEPEDYPVRG